MSERGDEHDEAEDPARAPGLVTDLLKRAVLTGVGAVLMTEEGIRNAVGELKLPKEAVTFLAAQAERTRTELARVVTQEVRRFLESETLQRQLWKILTGVTLEVNATIQLKPSGEPGIKASVRRREEIPEPPVEPARGEGGGPA